MPAANCPDLTEEYISAKEVQYLVIEAVCEVLGLTVEAFMVNKRTDYNSAFNRWLAYYFVKNNSRLSHQQIVSLVGQKSHNQVGYAIGKIEDQIQMRNKRIIRLITTIEDLIERKIQRQQEMVLQRSS